MRLQIKKPERGRSLHNESVYRRLILGESGMWQFQNFVKNEVTVDVSGMVNIPLGGLYLIGMSPLAYHIIRRRLCVTRSTK